MCYKVYVCPNPSASCPALESTKRVHVELNRGPVRCSAVASQQSSDLQTDNVSSMPRLAQQQQYCN